MAYIEKRISKAGKTSYRVMVRMKGHPTESATFERITDAKDWAKHTESAIKERRYFKTAESKKHTVKDMIERYLEQLKTDNPKRYKDVKPMLRWWKDEIGYCILSELSKALIVEKIEKLSLRKRTLKDGMEKHISPARINRYITAFGHVCTIATNEWEWLEQNPLSKIRKKKEPRGRIRFLSDEERNSLLKACKDVNSPYLYLIVVLALSTGARRSEITNLQWQDIDFNRNVITLHETKNGERRILPLAGTALSLIKDHNKIRRIDSDLVFPAPHDPSRPWDFRSAWDSAIEKAGITDFHFHDLRHSAASYLAMNGASLAEIAEVLGHKTLAMVKRYAHLSEAHTHSVVASMNERIFGE